MGEGVTDQSDLLLSMEEAHQERAGIMQDSGIQDPEALRTDLHRHEVASVIRRFYPKTNTVLAHKKAGEAVEAYLLLVEKKRGKEAADKLRTDCRVAWKKHSDEIASQA